MAEPRARKTIRNNPLDALGAEPLKKAKPAEKEAKSKSGSTRVRKDAVKNLGVDQLKDAPPPPKARAPKRSVDELFEEVLGAKTNVDETTKDTKAEQTDSPDQLHQPEEPPSQGADEKALAIVKTWSQWAALGGTVPAPFVDVALVSGAQIKMIHSLCKHYRIPFQKKLAFTLVSALAGGTMPTWLAQTLTLSALKTVPVVGSVMSLTAEPAMAFAATYAIGRTFVQHFESKGTLASFSARNMSGSFQRFFKTGQSLSKKSVA